MLAFMTTNGVRVRREQEERQRLAPFAVPSSESRGRRYAEAQHPVRLRFERDRDRILHSRCFRRLEYKSQVFVNGTADHYRTRLTHTMEMAAVSRTLARCLGVNEDLTEAIALAHDIGHAPFGHCTEATLDELTRETGGFDHNRQSLRWVELLELQYPGFPGLNLSWEVRAGLMKHDCSLPDAQLDDVPFGPHLFVEAQIADVADDMTYYAHDVDDALEAGVLDDGALASQPLWRQAESRTLAEYTGLSVQQHRRITVRNLLDIMVRDVMHTALERLAKFQPRDPAAVMAAPARVVAFSDPMRVMVDDFRHFLFDNFYRAPDIMATNREAVGMIRQLFLHYLEAPDTMGSKARARIETEGLKRTVCDYVSGFTDRYAMEEYARFGLERVAAGA